MEKQINELIEKYKLPQEEHNTILELLIKDLFTDRVGEKEPSIMFVVGQPGCGKTTFITSTSLSKYIIINSDEYRHLSKYSKEILSKYPTQYAKLTNHDAHLWGDELFDYAIQNGYSVLREKAPIDFSLLEQIKTIPNNYEVIINVVVEGNLESSLRTRERYEKEIRENNNAKLSNIEAHNNCYSLLPTFISMCISLGIKVNYVISNGSQFKIIPVGDNYLSLLQKFREESNKYACLTYSARIDSIKKSMTNRNATQEQFDELSKIESIYSELSKCDNKASKFKKS